MTSTSQLQQSAKDAIAVTIHYDRILFRRALTGWWQSVVPPEPFVKRVVVWAVVWLLIGGLTLGITALGLSAMFVLAGLIGAAFLVGVFGYLQRTRMNRFWDVLELHWDKAGAMTARFSPEGAVFEDSVSRREFAWSGVDAIKGIRGVKVIRTGFSMIAIPDISLPDGMEPRSFRVRLNDWRKP